MLFSSSIENCEYSAPEIRKLYVSDIQYFFGYNLNSNEEITAFRINPHFYEFDVVAKNFLETLEKVYYNQSISFNIVKLDAAKRKTLRDLRDTEVFIVFEDSNGLFWFLGEKGLTISNQDKKINDTDNNYSLSLQTINNSSSKVVIAEVSPWIPFPCPLSSAIVADYDSEFCIDYDSCLA